ncbi:small serum protein 2-like [Ctenopharyngodon idella]|uniref:small serum protein 2-like n=1 Tax=Ctenopharyngodon idella TaxID=7959 RepID=UPI0022326ADD|nr:small serum protein 2-like [Ctenopharyngodon idella]
MKDVKAGARYCTDADDKSQHPVGSTWTNNRCIRCTCSSNMMSCCDMMGKPIIKTGGCIVKYDYRTCTFKVFHPEDPTIMCSYGAVGK